MMARCEDFPCCGHTDADPCERQWYDEPGAFDTSRPGNEHALCEHENGICDVDYQADDDEGDGSPDWGVTAAGVPCNWCNGGEAEPADSDDAEQILCLGHRAEYEGESIDSLLRADAELAADRS